MPRLVATEPPSTAAERPPLARTITAVSVSEAQFVVELQTYELVPSAPAAVAAPAAAIDVASRLAALADLHAKGALTDDEFAAAKAQVLAGN